MGGLRAAQPRWLLVALALAAVYALGAALTEQPRAANREPGDAFAGPASAPYPSAITQVHLPLVIARYDPTVPTSTAVPTSTPTVTVCGTINQSQTWGAQPSAYAVACNVTVVAGVTITLAQQAFDLDESQSDSVYNEPVASLLVGKNMYASVAFTYNPDTHYVAAFLASSDRAPGRVYVVSYQADSYGQIVRNTYPSAATFTSP